MTVWTALLMEHIRGFGLVNGISNAGASVLFFDDKWSHSDKREWFTIEAMSYFIYRNSIFVCGDTERYQDAACLVTELS